MSQARSIASDLPMTQSPVKTLYLVKKCELGIHVLMEAALREFGLTPGQYTFLSKIRAHDGATSAQLARRLMIKPPSVNEYLLPLLDLKLVSRAASPTDRRILKVSITKKGVRMLQDCDAAVDRLEQDMLEGLSPRQLKEFRDYLFNLLSKTKVDSPAIDLATA